MLQMLKRVCFKDFSMNKRLAGSCGSLCISIKSFKKELMKENPKF